MDPGVNDFDPDLRKHPDSQFNPRIPVKVHLCGGVGEEVGADPLRFLTGEDQTKLIDLDLTKKLPFKMTSKLFY